MVANQRDKPTRDLVATADCLQNLRVEVLKLVQQVEKHVREEDEVKINLIRTYVQTCQKAGFRLTKLFFSAGRFPFFYQKLPEGWELQLPPIPFKGL